MFGIVIKHKICVMNLIENWRPLWESSHIDRSIFCAQSRRLERVIKHWIEESETYQVSCRKFDGKQRTKNKTAYLQKAHEAFHTSVVLSAVRRTNDRHCFFFWKTSKICPNGMAYFFTHTTQWYHALSTLRSFLLNPCKGSAHHMIRSCQGLSEGVRPRERRGSPPRWWRHSHDSVRPFRLTAARHINLKCWAAPQSNGMKGTTHLCCLALWMEPFLDLWTEKDKRKCSSMFCHDLSGAWKKWRWGKFRNVAWNTSWYISKGYPVRQFLNTRKPCGIRGFRCFCWPFFP